MKLKQKQHKEAQTLVAESGSMKFKENQEMGKTGAAERRPDTLIISVAQSFGTEKSWKFTLLRPSSNTFSPLTSKLALYMRCLNNSLNLRISQQNTEKELIRNLNFRDIQNCKREIYSQNIVQWLLIMPLTNGNCTGIHARMDCLKTSRMVVQVRMSKEKNYVNSQLFNSPVCTR